LSLKEGGDPLNPEHWTKSQEPLMTLSGQTKVYGPGHNSFATSPDGTEDWIIYHATTGMSDGWNNRKARAQKITWDEATGMPTFGEPLSLDTAIPVPSGEGVFKAEHAVQEGTSLTYDLIPAAMNTEAPLLVH